jgi:endo-1,4-beta-xylanase
LAEVVATPGPGTAGVGQGLDAIARRRGLYFGCAIRPEYLRADVPLCEIVLRECSRLTPELALKWAAIQPTRGGLNFTDIDDLAAFAVRHGKRLRGHTLLWHESVPAWAPDQLREPDGWKVISGYFGSVMPRFGEVVQTWDVVNEPIDVGGGRADGLRVNPFLTAFGPDYVSRALKEARIFAPRATLMINEYGLEYDADEDRRRRRALLTLIEGLKKQGAPIDGLGLQSHLDLCKGAISQPALRAFLKEVMDLGLSVEVTELDVKECAYTATARDRDLMVADAVRRYLDVVLDAERVAGVTTWGISDRHSWLIVRPADYARFPGAWRGGGGPGLNRGLPYDAALAPKPMYQAIAQAMQTRRPGLIA